MLRKIFTKLAIQTSPKVAKAINALASIGSDDRVNKFIELDSSGLLEKYSIYPSISPGPISNFEILGRWIYTPSHVKHPLPGELSDSAFESIYANGLSLQRIHCHWRLSRNEVHSLGLSTVVNDSKNRAEGDSRPNRKYLGVIKFCAKDLRSIELQDLQETSLSVRIYDTAQVDNSKHSEAMAKVEAKSKKQRKMALQQLRIQFYMLAKKSGIYKSPYLHDEDSDLSALKLKINDHSFTNTSS